MRLFQQTQRPVLLPFDIQNRSFPSLVTVSYAPLLDLGPFGAGTARK